MPTRQPSPLWCSTLPTGQPVPNALATRIENASGDVIFQPNPGSSTYHVYYMPWHSTGSYYPTITYPDMAPEPDAAWAEAVQAAADLPQARTTHIQSVDDFHSFFPMEVIATPEETAAFMGGADPGWRLVAEHRDFPVRMRHFIPWHWTTRPDMDVLSSRVLRDEAFTFQVVVVADERGSDRPRGLLRGLPRVVARDSHLLQLRGHQREGRAVRERHLRCRQVPSSLYGSGFGSRRTSRRGRSKARSL